MALPHRVDTCTSCRGPLKPATAVAPGLPKQATGARRQLEPDPYFYVVLARWSAALFTHNIHGTRHGQPPHRSVHFTSRHTRAKVRARSFS